MISIGDEVTFTIEITNLGSTVIVILPLQDNYNPAFLGFIEAIPAHDAYVPGQINWNDFDPLLRGSPAQEEHDPLTAWSSPRRRPPAARPTRPPSTTPWITSGNLRCAESGPGASPAAHLRASDELQRHAGRGRMWRFGLETSTERSTTSASISSEAPQIAFLKMRYRSMPA